MHQVANFVSKYKYDMSAIALLGFQLWLMRPSFDKMHDWCTTPYALTYEYGIGPRFFIGTIVLAMTRFLSTRFLYLFILISLVALIVLVSFFFGSCIRSIRRVEQPDGLIVGRSPATSTEVAISAIVILYLSSPASVAYLFGTGNFERLDLYLLLYSIVAMFCLRTKHFKFIIPLLCVIAVATHEVFVFTYCPLVIVILLFHLHESNYNRRSISLLAVTAGCTLLTFMYFQFFATISVSDMDTWISLIQQRTNVPIAADVLRYEYFTATPVKQLVTVDRLQIGLVVIVLMLPLHFILAKIHLLAMNNSSTVGRKMSLALILGLPILSLPAFIMTSDWGRWFAAVYTVQIFAILYLAWTRCDPVISALRGFSELIKKHPFLFGVLILYFNMLGKFGASGILNVAVSCRDMFASIFRVIGDLHP